MHPLLRRESACPVHFLWDGLGLGRWLVRLGFLGFIVAAMLALGARLLGLEAPVWIAVVVAGGAWSLGQLLSMAVAARLRARRRT